MNVDLSGIKVVLDCANGAAYKVGPMVFEELGATVISINNTPDGNNINDKCGSTHPESLQKAVVEHNADLGLAYDGDADRLISVNEKGQIVDGDHIMILSAIYLKKHNKLAQDTLVVTVMSNIGLTIAAKEYGIDLATTAVGDRYVLEEMKNSGFNLGGEQSGHIIFSKHATTGDGILTAIKLMEVMLEKKQTLGTLCKGMTMYPQLLKNVRVEDKAVIMENAKVQELGKKIAAGQIVVKIKTGEGGRTFGSVSSKEIAVAVKEQMGYDIDKKKIQMKDSIKNLGTYIVPVKLHAKVTAELKVHVGEA